MVRRVARGCGREGIGRKIAYARHEHPEHAAEPEAHDAREEGLAQAGLHSGLDLGDSLADAVSSWIGGHVGESEGR